MKPLNNTLFKVELIFGDPYQIAFHRRLSISLEEKQKQEDELAKLPAKNQIKLFE